MDLQEIGEQVRTARKAKRLTQTDVAERARISRNRLVALENGSLTDIGYNTLKPILEILGLDLRMTTLNAGRPTLDDLAVDNEEEVPDAPRLGR